MCELRLLLRVILLLLTTRGGRGGAGEGLPGEELLTNVTTWGRGRGGGRGGAEEGAEEGVEEGVDIKQKDPLKLPEKEAERCIRPLLSCLGGIRGDTPASLSV